MTDTVVDVGTAADGSLVIQPHGVLDAEGAAELRLALVHAVRRIRPLRLILDLRDVPELDPISVGTLAAACALGDDHQVTVFLDNASTAVASRLTAAGVARHRLRSGPRDRSPRDRIPRDRTPGD